MKNLIKHRDFQISTAVEDSGRFAHIHEKRPDYHNMEAIQLFGNSKRVGRLRKKKLVFNVDSGNKSKV